MLCTTRCAATRRLQMLLTSIRMTESCVPAIHHPDTVQDIAATTSIITTQANYGVEVCISPAPEMRVFGGVNKPVQCEAGQLDGPAHLDQSQQAAFPPPFQNSAGYLVAHRHFQGMKCQDTCVQCARWHRCTIPIAFSRLAKQANNACMLSPVMNACMKRPTFFSTHAIRLSCEFVYC